MKVLLVKMSSLGDVIHALPAVTDAAREGVRFDWVVEEAFGDIPRMHPAVDQVIPIAWRRWRRALGASRSELREFRNRLRSTDYDLILDSQGLIKSAVVARLARGRVRGGFDRNSAREGLAALAYQRAFPVARGQHAIERQRQLFAAALATSPSGKPDFGLPVDAAGDGSVVLAHGTTWVSKEWPELLWLALARRARAAGYSVRVPWGNDSERSRAERIARACDGEVLPRGSIGELASVLSSASAVVGVDSGVTHLSGALGTPTVVLYGSTDSRLTGCRGARVQNLDVTFACAPCLKRECGYTGSPGRYDGQIITPACYGTLDPDNVWRTATEVMGADRLHHI